MKAGHLQYQIEVFSDDLDLVNQSLKDLNFEAAALQAKQKAEVDAKGSKTSSSSVSRT